MSNSTQEIPSGEAPFDFYVYRPSKNAAFAFTGLFAVMVVVHFILMIRHRVAFFIPLMLGTGMEVGGYYFRTMSADNLRKIGPYIGQFLLIMAAPPMLAATIYMTFSRIITSLHGQEYAPISTKWLTTLFVLGDLACLISQFIGSVQSGDANPNTAKVGTDVVLGGLILQICMFSLFLLLLALFHRRFARYGGGVLHLKWRRHMVVLYVISGVFIVRNAVRIVEFSQGPDGYIITHESMLYAFDATFMLVVVLIPAVIHPGSLVRASKKSMKELGEGSTELSPFVERGALK